MTNKTELLPCPFCGTDDDIDPAGVLNGDGTRSPECMGCGATAPTVATWNCRIAAPAEDVRAVAPTIDFNEEILLPCPPGVRVGFCGDVKLSFDGAEYRGRAWLMEQGGKEEWVAIEGPENARKAGEALIKWAEAWEGQSDEDRS